MPAACGRAAPDAEPPGKWVRIRGLVIAGAATALATGYVALVDPNDPGHYPICPLKLLTGIDCPACGGLRATHAVIHGDLVTAADHNLLVTILLPVAVLAWAWTLWQRWRGDTARLPRGSSRGRSALIAGAIILVVLFTILRNVPLVPFLNSAAG